MKTDIREIENKYRNSAKTYQNAITAWQNVKRATKKDGSDFANFGKNTCLISHACIGTKFV